MPGSPPIVFGLTTPPETLADMLIDKVSVLDRVDWRLFHEEFVPSKDRMQNLHEIEVLVVLSC
jgi:hypothetical protein